MGIHISNLVEEEKLQTSTANTMTFVGIDFGTSTTVISYAYINEKEEIETKTIEINQQFDNGTIEKNEIFSSVIAWKNNKLLFGNGARQLKNSLIKGKNIWHSFKMGLGIDLGSQYYYSDLNGKDGRVKIQNDQDATLAFFRYLKEQIDDYINNNDLPKPTKYAVSIPASFQVNQRKDLLKALENAGIKISEEILIDEPNAALISYIDSFGEKLFSIIERKPINILVYDFGAGTCDISIIELSKCNGKIYSKNLAISNFIALGGDDIDIVIAKEILLPQMEVKNNKDIHEIKDVEIKKGVLPILQSIGEQLKIAICKKVAVAKHSTNLPKVAQSDTKMWTTKSCEIKLNDHTLYKEKLYIQYFQFEAIMKKLINKTSDNSLNLFDPIESSLLKADLNPNEINMFLLIGGSVQNPYLQSYLYDAYSEYGCELEIPSNPRDHVSRGAAIHSLLSNGYHCNIIQPILGESIITVVQDNHICELFKNGIEVPSENVKIEGFFINKSNQKKLQIPICSGNKEKIIAVIEIDLEKHKFKPGDPVLLNCSLNKNKTIEVTTVIKGININTSVINSLSNTAISGNQRLSLEIEKEVNNITASNNGRPTLESLTRLKDAHILNHDYIRAAELLEQIQKIDPNNSYEGDINYYYSLGGNRILSDKWSRKAYDRCKNDVTAFNLALTYKVNGDLGLYENLCEESIKINSNAYFTLENYGFYLYNAKGNVVDGLNFLKRAFDIMKHLFLEGDLDRNDYPRLERVAKFFKEDSLIKELNKFNRTSSDSNFYNNDYLLSHNNPQQSPKKGA
ncbi:Hsp70 family protein [Synechocystis sp. PCC 7338]|uniref:Hsp70 family protein n=1 Tax=Synechocystis sp. PCC 7338 TaxID=2732530 RepID=UPI001BAE6A4F|nr:Hsp70 family protein [Synechocystis sp. PCC 7338]QUS61114.1 Hsp70 family protein [Synechocystis sp. PCC 7338]